MDHKEYTTPNDVAEDLSMEILEQLQMAKVQMLAARHYSEVALRCAKKPISVVYEIVVFDDEGNVIRGTVGAVLWQHGLSDEVSAQRALERLKDELDLGILPF